MDNSKILESNFQITNPSYTKKDVERTNKFI